MLNLATTFNENGYKLYGKRWIESVAEYWPKNTNVRLYLDFEIPNLPNNFKIINFSKTFPHHTEVCDTISQQYKIGKAKGIGLKTIKFSYKGFVIGNELKYNKGVFVWADGDTETLNYVDSNKLKALLQNNFLACQMEKPQSNQPHVESGFLLYDLKHNDTKLFEKHFNDYYCTNKLFSIKKPYDGYVIARVIKDLNLSYNDLNTGYNVLQKRSQANETFLHPYLKNHFIHRIGNNKNLKSI